VWLVPCGSFFVPVHRLEEEEPRITQRAQRKNLATVHLLKKNHEIREIREKILVSDTSTVLSE